VTEDTDHLWWQTGVIYQIYPRSFADTTGNGIGDLAGVIRRLDYLSETLGVDAVWFSPFHRSPMADFGYDASDQCDVDPVFGDLAVFDELVAGAHRRSLRVIVDYVPTYTSDQHAWFIESRASRDSAKRDWYVWRDPKPDGSPPSNWLSIFGGLAWEWDEATGQYYLHTFLKEMPDLNWRNPEVKQAMFDVARFWLERGVDGFRVDTTHIIMKDPELRDNPPSPAGQLAFHRPMGDYDSQLHIYDKGHPDVHAVYRDFRQMLDDYGDERPRMAVGEVHIFDWAEWASYYGQNLDELHMPYNFALLNVEWDGLAVRQVVDSLEAALPPGAWPNYVLGNHDESRFVTRYGRSQARVGAMLQLTLRGTPTIYYGDEIGMDDVPIPADEILDPWGINVDPDLSRDPCRTPMQWSPAPNAGFSAPEVSKLWLPLAADYAEVNVESELADPTSILNLYRRLLTYRRESPALRWGSYQPVDGVPPTCFVYKRRSEDKTVLVALNFAAEEQRIAVPALGDGRIVISTHLDRDEAVSLVDLMLRGDEGVVIELSPERL
jgi:glycosidase